MDCIKVLKAAGSLADDGSVDVVFEIARRFVVTAAITNDELNSLDESTLREILGGLVDEIAGQERTSESIEIGNILEIRDGETGSEIKVASHALETPGDFSPDEIQTQVIGDIGPFLSRLENEDDAALSLDEVRGEWEHEVGESDENRNFQDWIAAKHPHLLPMLAAEVLPATAFQITEKDIENVLRDYSLRVTDTEGKSFETMSSELIGEIDHVRVQKAALSSGVTIEEQATGANDEIRKILIEIGVLEF